MKQITKSKFFVLLFILLIGVVCKISIDSPNGIVSAQENIIDTLYGTWALYDDDGYVFPEQQRGTLYFLKFDSSGTYIYQSTGALLQSAYAQRINTIFPYISGTYQINDTLITFDKFGKFFYKLFYLDLNQVDPVLRSDRYKLKLTPVDSTTKLGTPIYPYSYEYYKLKNLQ